MLETSVQRLLRDWPRIVFEVIATNESKISALDSKARDAGLVRLDIVWQQTIKVHLRALSWIWRSQRGNRCGNWYSDPGHIQQYFTLRQSLTGSAF